MIGASMKLLRITSKYFCAGLEVGGRCAPILSYMRGWTEDRIRKYCERKNWECEEVDSRVAKPVDAADC